jgi:hypothetical protein
MPEVHRNDLPLDEAVGYATHILIRCDGPVYPFCSRSVVWLTSDLYAKLPHCRTLGEFKRKLVCRKCKRRGWVRIEAAGR